MEIIGRPTATFTTLKNALHARPGVHTRFVTEMLPALWDEAVRYGVNPTGVVAQSGKETAWGNFGGAVKPEFYNTCGLKNRQSLYPGVDDSDNPLAHARFASWRVGARAHVQHLRGYTGFVLPADELIISPRYVHLSGKKAVHFRDLGGHWAPDLNYGVSIESIADELLAPPPFP